MKYHRVFCLCLLGIVLLSPTANAGDYIVELYESDVDVAAEGVGPGDTVWVRAGTRRTLILRNIVGTPEQPILVTNYGGQVIFQNGSSHAFQFRYSSNFIVRGTPDPGNYDYGIRVLYNRSGNSGMAFEYRTTDFEVCDIEIANSGFAGIIAKDDNEQRPDWVMKNVYIHDLYIHDTRGEGLYIGSSFWNGGGHELHNVHVYNNLVVNAGWDGIQMGCANQNSSLHDNVIINSGTRYELYQQNGIQIGEGCATHVYNNTVIGGTGDGLFFAGLGYNKIYNNLFIRQARNAFYITGKGHLYETPFYIMNNTIIQPGDHGCWYWAFRDDGSIFANNLIVDPNDDYINYYRDDSLIVEFNNLYLPTLSAAGFVSSGSDDYHLLASSPAVDAGANLAGLGVTYDLDNFSRPSGAATDIGAYEYDSPGNDAPSVSAGPDRTLSSQGNAVTLGGEVSDDGLPGPLAVAWSKVSGTGEVTFDDPSAPNTTAHLSASGVYVLRLTADDGQYVQSDEMVVDFIWQPHLVYGHTDLGDGLHGWTFRIANDDGLDQSYATTLAFYTDAGTDLINVQINGMDVNDEPMALLAAGFGFDPDRDTYSLTPFVAANSIPGNSELFGDSFTGYREGDGWWEMAVGTGASSQYGDDTPVAYVVADGNVHWLGTVARDNQLYLTQGFTGLTQTLLGDYTGNGVVDTADYTWWADHFGQMCSAVLAPGSYVEPDHPVGTVEYTIWADHFGDSIGQTLEASAPSMPVALKISVPPVAGGPSVGDFNSDGRVDQVDYVIWQDNVDKTGSDVLGDANGDGWVNTADLTVLYDHFGKGVNR